MQDSKLAIRKSIVVDTPVETAFRVFTEGIATWWPMHKYSVSEERTRSVTMERRVGGRLYETDADGAAHEWGTVTSWDPPNAVSFTWHPGYDDPSVHTVVTVSFSADGERTRVELTHSDWENLGERAKEMVQRYTAGWDEVLGAFADAAGGS